MPYSKYIGYPVPKKYFLQLRVLSLHDEYSSMVCFSVLCHPQYVYSGLTSVPCTRHDA